MALRKGEPVTLQFAGGIETKMDSKQVPPVRVLDLQNGVFIKATTIAKRNGYAAEDLTIDGTGGTKIGQARPPVGLAERDGEVIMFDGRTSYSRRDSSGTFSEIGEVCSTKMSDVSIARTGTRQTQADHASLSGVTITAWEDSRGGVWCSIVEQATGKILLADTQLDAGGISPRCLANSDRLQILWANAARRQVMIAVIDPELVEVVPAGAMLVDDLDPANPVYDAEYSNDIEGAAALVWALDTGGFTVGWIHPSGALAGPAIGFPAATHFADTVSGAIAIGVEHTAIASIAIVFETTAFAINTYLLSSSFGVLTGPTTLMTAPAHALRIVVAHDDQDLGSDGRIWWAVEIPPTIFFGPTPPTDQRTVYCGSYNGTILVDGSTRILRGHCLASRAFIDNGDVYCTVVHAVRFFPYYAVVRMSGASWGSRTTVAARIFPGNAIGAPTRAMVPNAHPLDSTDASKARQHAIALGYRIQLSADDSQFASTNFGEEGIRVVSIDFNASDAYQAVQLGRGLYLASGAGIMHYDGARWAEAGFHAAPDGQTDGTAPLFSAADAGVTAGAAMAAGTYNYLAWYEEVDNQGEVHRGPVAVPVQAVLGGSGDHGATITVPTCRLTGKKNVRICVGRSPVNQTGAPNAIPYYRITSLDPSHISGNNRYLANDPTVDSVSITDGLSDVQLLTKEPVYTNGGILGNDPCPCAGGPIITGKFRLFWLDPSDPNIVRFSQPLSDDDTAMEESAALTQRLDPFGGKAVALALMDDMVVAFKETAFQGFVGPGPDRDGGASSQDAFSPSQEITSDAGCSSSRAIVKSPDGLLFPTSKGICLLGRDRAGQISVGDPVYAYKDQSFVRATLLPDRRHILFLTDDDGGRSLLYDYEHKMWSTFTNHEGRDGVVAGGVYFYLRTDGRLFRETPGVFADDQSHIRLLVSTAWVKFAGYLQAFQKVLWAQINGTYKSSHQLRARVRFDYEDTWSEPVLVNVDAVYVPALYGAGLYGSGVFGGVDILNTVYEQKFHINRTCQAVAFEFSDVEADGVFGASFELSELLLIGGVLGPQYPIGASRSQ